MYGLKPPAAGKRAQPGMGSCVATARDFVCQTVLKKRRAPAPAAGAAATPADAAARDPNPAGLGSGARTGSAERGRPAPPLHLFHDESLNSFVRRLAWSPEGAPAAVSATCSGALCITQGGCARVLSRVYTCLAAGLSAQGPQPSFRLASVHTSLCMHPLDSYSSAHQVPVCSSAVVPGHASVVKKIIHRVAAGARWCRMQHTCFGTAGSAAWCAGAGSLLAVPAGLFQAREGAPVQNAAYLYARGQWTAPWLALPALKACPMSCSNLLACIAQSSWPRCAGRSPSVQGRSPPACLLTPPAKLAVLMPKSTMAACLSRL